MPAQQPAEMQWSQIARRSGAVSLVRMASQPSRGLHGHDFVELVLILAGRGIHLLEDDRFPIAAGDAFVIHRGRRHGYLDTAGLRLVNLIYRPELLPLPFGDLERLPGYHALFAVEPRLRDAQRARGLLRLRPDDLGNAVAIVDSIDAELRSRQPGSDAMAAIRFLELVCLLSRCPSVRRTAEARTTRGVAAALALIEQRLDDPLTLEDLEASSGLHGNTLLRAFRRVTGTTPIDHLIRRRVARSCELLRRDDLRIVEVALRVGFEDAGYFARQFRRVMGCTPSAWRRLNRDQPAAPPRNDASTRR